MYRNGCIPSRATSFLIIFSDPVPIAASGRDIVFNHSTGPRRPTRPQTAIRFHRANSGNKNVVAAEMQRVSDRYLMAANGSPRACASGKGCNDGPVGNGPRLRDIKRSRASISSPRVSAIDRKKPRFNLATRHSVSKIFSPLSSQFFCSTETGFPRRLGAELPAFLSTTDGRTTDSVNRISVVLWVIE